MNENNTPILSERDKQTLRSANSNDGMENGDIFLSEFNLLKSPSHSEIKTSNELTSNTSFHSIPIDQNIPHHSYKSNHPLTPVTSPSSTSINVENSQRNNLSDIISEEDNDDDSQVVTNQEPVLSARQTNSTAISDDNDVIEIHQFSLADIDAYLDIYFETLDNRLRHFIGGNDQLQQFRLIMKNRIRSDSNAREHRNVLLGKLNGEVVAAVILLFSDEITTISNDNILLEENSCLTSIRRWMIRKANYIPNHTEECYIEMIGVKSAYRNRGIGAALLECIEHFARQAGARLLTIHINREQLRHYFQRFGFVLDPSDNSTFWKGIVERESIHKMSKTISPDENSRINNGGYINESMAEDPDE